MRIQTPFGKVTTPQDKSSTPNPENFETPLTFRIQHHQPTSLRGGGVEAMHVSVLRRFKNFKYFEFNIKFQSSY